MSFDSNKMPLKNIIGINFYNFSRHKNSLWADTPYPHKCCITFEVMEKPKFVYEIVDNCLVSYDENTGFMNSYEIKHGTTRGFAGAKITLPVIGQGTVFKKKGISYITYIGCLWDTQKAKQVCYKHFKKNGVSIAYKHRYKDQCGFAAEIAEDVYQAALLMTGLLKARKRV